MDLRPETPQEKILVQWAIGILWLGVFVALFFGFAAWQGSLPENAPSRCRVAIQEMQAIRELDGTGRAAKTAPVRDCGRPENFFAFTSGSSSRASYNDPALVRDLIKAMLGL
jgi:hypothetical protein